MSFKRAVRSTLVLIGYAAMPVFASASPPAAQPLVILEFFDPAEGHQSDFGTWWSAQLNKLRSSPGIVSATPFQRASTPLKRPSAAPLPNHMIVLILDGRDQAEVLRVVRATSATSSSAVDAGSARIFLYRQTGTWNSTTPETAGDFYRQLVFGNSMPGREDAFNDWYNNTHARDLVTVPGVVSVSRFVFVKTLLGPVDAPPKYLSMMDFRTTSVEEFSVRLDQMGTHFTNTDDFDGTHAWRHLYQQLGVAP